MGSFDDHLRRRDLAGATPRTPTVALDIRRRLWFSRWRGRREPPGPFVPCAGLWPQPPNQKHMSLSEGSSRPTTSTTEITLVTGDRYRVESDLKSVERIILDAARGSIMQLAWLVEVDTGENLGVNPEHVVLLRAVDA
jgi:hypothetical protein